MLDFISTNKQLAYIFTKPLGEDRFSMIRKKLGICDHFDYFFSSS